MSNKSDGTLGLITHYQKKLDKYNQTGEHEKLVYCIHKLKYLPVTVNHLEVTGVGKSINSLRHMQGEVGEKAKALVQKWKQMVSAEEQEEPHQELHGQYHPNDNHVRELSVHEDDDDSDENSRLQIEEKNYNVIENNYEADEENCNGYDPKTSRQDYQSIGAISTNIQPYNPVDIGDTKYCSNQNNNASCLPLTSDNQANKEEKNKYEDKYVKKKHHKSKSHHSSGSNSKSSKSRKDKDLSPISNEIDSKVIKIKSRDKERHKHKHKSSISHSDLEKSLNSSNQSSQNKLKETSYSKGNHLDLNKNLDSHQSTSSNSFPKKEEKNSKCNEILCLNESTIMKDSKEINNKSDSSNSSSKRSSSKSNEKSKRKKDSEMESSGFELALKDMDLPTKKKKKKKSKDKDEDNSENKLEGRSSLLKQPTLLNADYGKNLPSLPSFDNEPLSSQLMVHYKPLPQIPQRSTANDPFHSRMTDEEALNYMLASRNNSRNRKIYAGKASGLASVPTLYDCCIKVLQENIEALELTGDIPYEILKPVLERASPQQLFVLEDYNPYLLDDSDELWGMHCRKSFKNKVKEEMENWRDMYIRCTDEQQHRMKVVTESLTKKYETKVPARRTTQLAFAKPPKSVARAQAKYGTWSSPSSPQKPSSSYKPEGGTQPIQRNVTNNSRPDRPIQQYKPPTAKKPKVAPLMAKTRQLMKKVCRR